jgi:hypothetical protein
MTFLPEDYKIPKAPSGYMKFAEGLNQIRILDSAIIGWEYFNQANKPVRQREAFEEVPRDIKENGRVKHFWAFPVWNYQAKSVQILEITQKGIMEAIKALVKNPKWGDPKMYDIAITKSGEGLDTEYTVQGEPPLSEPTEEIVKAYKNKPVNLEALYLGEDPFAKELISKDDLPN